LAQPGMPPGQMSGGRPGMGSGMVWGFVDTTNHKITVMKLKHAKAEQLATVLKQVFSTADITPETRTNQLIVRASPEQTLEVSKLLAELDVDVPGK
jgi:type II secretory pathway component GspD/PulD (secretin)